MGYTPDIIRYKLDSVLRKCAELFFPFQNPSFILLRRDYSFVWLVYFKSPLHHTAAKLTSPVILEPVLEDK